MSAAPAETGTAAPARLSSNSDTETLTDNKCLYFKLLSSGVVCYAMPNNEYRLH